MKNYVFYCKKILEKGSSLDEFGELLDNYWNLKKNYQKMFLITLLMKFMKKLKFLEPLEEK